MTHYVKFDSSILAKISHRGLPHLSIQNTALNNKGILG